MTAGSAVKITKWNADGTFLVVGNWTATISPSSVSREWLAVGPSGFIFRPTVSSSGTGVPIHTGFSCCAALFSVKFNLNLNEYFVSGEFWRLITSCYRLSMLLALRGDERKPILQEKGLRMFSIKLKTSRSYKLSRTFTSDLLII